MPELIEVNIIRKVLKKLINNKTLTDIAIPIDSKYYDTPFNGYENIKLPLKIINVGNKGKCIYIEFSNKTYLIIKLLLSGSITINEPKNFNNCILELVIDNDMIYYINDPLRFIYIRYCNINEYHEEMNNIGKQYDKITFKEFEIKLNEHYKDFIANFLTNQHLFSGIGNYLLNEILYKSGIHPFSIIENIPSNKIYELFKSIKEILKEVYNNNGVDVRKHTDLIKVVSMKPISPKGLDKQIIKNDDFFKVYRQKIDPYGNKISKIDRTRMSSFYIVPKLQIKYGQNGQFVSKKQYK